MHQDRPTAETITPWGPPSESAARLAPAPSPPPPAGPRRPMPPPPGSPPGAVAPVLPPTPGPSMPAPGHPLVLPPKKNGCSTARILTLAGVLALLSLGAIVTIVFASLSIVSATVERSVPSTAEVGACYDRSGAGDRSVSCQGRHHFEVFGVIIYGPNEGYPGRIDRSVLSGACDSEFVAYTGIQPLSSPLSLTLVPPSEELWEIGDRRAVCVLHRDDFGPLTGSEALWSR